MCWMTFVDLRDAHGEHSFNWPVIYDNFSIFELLIRLTVSVQNMDISALLMRESYPFIRL